ncbi:MAG TPA: hypothetical protein VEB18_01435 [Candidatus Paceibacterota bacterium]|nr:hypothetical protein [Candidatus Paceibacterota bacterium]
MLRAAYLSLVVALLLPVLGITTHAEEEVLGGSLEKVLPEIISQPEDPTLPEIEISSENIPLGEIPEAESSFEILTLGSDSDLLLVQDDSSYEIEFSGAAGGEYHELTPRPIYTALASGHVSKVRLYLAQNTITSEPRISGNWLSIELKSPETHEHICWLLSAQENGSGYAHENYAAIPVGDASTVALITFDHPESDCVLEAGAQYEISLVYRVNGDPRWTNGVIYTKGANETEIFLQVTASDFEESEPVCEAPCASNVLFLPGIKGSRLYINNGSEEKVWDPLGEDDINLLLLNEDGKSQEAIYTKEGDVIDSVMSFIDIYDDFIEHMDDLQVNGAINEWRPVAYDWRLSLEDIVETGAERDGRIFYGEATSTPYIEQTLRSLAANSKTGKVTIIAHSNGGLVAKALFEKLGPEATEELVDNVIFVGVPQSGAPQAIGALLFGYKEGLPWWFPFLVSPATARDFAERSPMGYHLLPTERYFESTKNSGTHPVARFSETYSAERNMYGETIDNFAELKDFLQAAEGGRSKPDTSDFENANVLHSTLLSYAEQIHTSIDSWTPPGEVTLYQIAGWGEDTISGIEFYEECGTSCNKKYRPVFIEDGDGVVPVASALMMEEEILNIQNFWVNIRDHNKDNTDRDHGNFLEMDDVQTFISNLLLQEDREVVFIKDSPVIQQQETKKLIFFLHSPLTLELHDNRGNRTGPVDDGSEEENVPDSHYGRFGEVQYIIAPAGAEYRVELHGLDEGTFSLDIQEMEDGNVTQTSTVTNLPVSPNTFATFAISNGIEDATPLAIDENGDGETEILIAMTSGETVAYEPQEITGSSSSRGSNRVVKSDEKDAPEYLIPTITSTPPPTPEFFNWLIPVSQTTTMELETGPTTTEEVVSSVRTQTASIYDSLNSQNWFFDLPRLLYSIMKEILTWFKNIF